jgi:ferredoxin
MTHVIFDLCIRDGACVEVCPVECIVPGEPEDQWPWFYIDPETCIDCGACVPECPVDAIRPEDDLLPEYAGSTELNARYFSAGPGYSAKK